MTGPVHDRPASDDREAATAQIRALSDEPSSMLIVFAPGAPRENYFRELAAIRDSGRTMSGDEWAAFLAEHDQYSVDQPRDPA